MPPRAENRRILVTGASGFYGRHVLPFLKSKGYETIAVVRRDGLPGSSIMISDIADDVDWVRHLENTHAVVHLAGLAHGTVKYPDAEYDRVNRLGTRRLVRAAAQAGVRFVYISSIAAQSGSSSDDVLLETQAPKPTTAYGLSKLRAEQEIAEVTKDYVVFRPTLTYGAGVRGNIGRLIDVSLSRIPPPLGSLTNLRSLLGIENLCAAVLFALEEDTALGQTFLLADPDPLTVADMILALRQGAGLKGGGIRVPLSLVASGLRLIGRTDLWDKVGGKLVVSVERLRNSGFNWVIGSRDGLRAMGESYAAEQRGNP